MANVKKTPEKVERAVAMMRSGSTLVQAAEAVGVSPATVMRWEREAPPAPPRAAAAPPAEPETPGGRVDIDEFRKMMRDGMRASEEAKANGNMREAIALANMAAKMAPVIQRAEAAIGADPDALRFTRSELARAEASILDRAKKICDRPLLCAGCSRALSVEWGSGTSQSAPAEPEA